MAGKNVKTLRKRFYGVAKKLSGNWDPQGIVCFVFLLSPEYPEGPLKRLQGTGAGSEQQGAAVGHLHL